MIYQFVVTCEVSRHLYGLENTAHKTLDTVFHYTDLQAGQ